MANSAKDKILFHIHSQGRGWVFSAADFTSNLPRWKIDRSLADLARDGKIRRVMQGLYDYPMYSSILEKEVATSIMKAAEAIARKYGWRLYPTGNMILNYFGLSTQMVAKCIQLSDGPSRTYRVGNREIFFRHIPAKEIGEHLETTLVIHAIKAAGERQITKGFLSALSERYSASEWNRIKKDAAKTTGWIYRQICHIVDLLNEEESVRNNANVG